MIQQLKIFTLLTFILCIGAQDLMAQRRTTREPRERTDDKSREDDANMEIKINPIGVLFGNADIGIEFIRDGISFEVFPSFISRTVGITDLRYSGLGLGAAARYYFNPEYARATKLFMAPYARFSRTSTRFANQDNRTNTRFAVGFMVGYKWKSQGPITFELAFGLGRNFVNDWSFGDDFNGDRESLGRLAVGYRF